MTLHRGLHMRKLLGLATLTLLAGCGAAPAILPTGLMMSEPATIEFRIPVGTGTGSWNTRDNPVVVTIGDTLHIVNDDTIRHRLHTDGKPCPHGPEMLPGGSFDCAITRSIDPDSDGSLYDHYVGPSAKFWIKAVTPERRLLDF
jgi:hypothetical protein